MPNAGCEMLILNDLILNQEISIGSLEVRIQLLYVAIQFSLTSKSQCSKCFSNAADHVYSLSCLTRIGSKAALCWHTLCEYKVQNVEAARPFRSCYTCSETIKPAAQLPDRLSRQVKQEQTSAILCRTQVFPCSTCSGIFRQCVLPIHRRLLWHDVKCWMPLWSHWSWGLSLVSGCAASIFFPSHPLLNTP